MFQEELGGPMLDGTFVLHSVTLPDSGPVDCPHRDDADAWGLCRLTRTNIIFVAGFPVPQIYDASAWISREHLPNYGPRTPDVDQNSYINADDFDLFSIAFESGCPCADYLGTGFVTGDSWDAFVADFEAGVTP